MVIGVRNFMIKHVSESNVEENLREKRENSSGEIVTAAENNSDLIPSVYEGGLKIWECSVDLVGYLMESGIGFEGKRVLEIGCGAGLPGILTVFERSES